jgi:hypothetical protein
MNEESIPHAPAIPAVQLVAQGLPQDASQNPKTYPEGSLISARKDESATIIIEDKLHVLSEVAPEKHFLPEIGHISRQRAIAKYLWCACGSALDRAFVLLIAVAILTTLKHIGCACGLIGP